MQKRFFTHSGKSLKNPLNTKQSISSLVDINESISLLYSIDETNLLNYSKSSKLITTFKETVSKSRQILNNKLNLILRLYKLGNINIISKFVISISQTKLATYFASLIVVFLLGISVNAMVNPNRLQPKIEDKYFIYSSKPLTLEESKVKLNTNDSRAEKIDAVMSAYKCPMEGLGEVFVEEADDNNIPWYIVASIAFQESSCGKNTPKADSSESYNAWGWGVYGQNVYMFQSWAHGIEVVSKYLSDNFYSKDITNTCEIMKTYTPPSNGSWCNGVNHFAEIIENYQTPQN